MKRDLRVLAVIMQWHYGNPKLGLSAEKTMFLDPLSSLCREVKPFWFDEHMHNPGMLERKLQESVETYAPDLIFFSTYRDQFRPEFLDLLKRQCRTVGWFGDDQWRFENFTVNYAKHYSTCITTDPLAIAKYRAIGCEPILSQWAADDATKMQAPLPPEGDFLYDVSFVGANNEVRSWFVRALGKEGIAVECFGEKWPNGLLPYDKIASTFYRSRINLNLFNGVHNDIRYVLGGARNFARWLVSENRGGQIKMRNFEIPLAGGFELAQYALGIERYFDVGQELAVFTSPEDCAAQIRHYIESPQERYEIALRGHERTKGEHTYFHRFSKILDQLYKQPEQDEIAEAFVPTAS